MFKLSSFFTDPIYRSFITPSLYDSLYEGGTVTDIPAPAMLDRLKTENFRGVGKDFTFHMCVLSNTLNKKRIHVVDYKLGD